MVLGVAGDGDTDSGVDGGGIYEKSRNIPLCWIGKPDQLWSVRCGGSNWIVRG